MVSTLNRKLLRDIRRQRAQFVAIGITVFLGVTIFGATYDSFRNLQTSYARTSTEFHFANLTVEGGDIEAFASRARSTSGVESVDLRTVADTPLQVGDVKLLGRVVGIPADATVNRVRVTGGGQPGPGELLVEGHMAAHFALTAGDQIRAFGSSGWENLTVTGTAASPEYIWPARSRQEIVTSPDNFGVVFMPQESAQSVIGPPNQAVIYYTGGDPNETLTSALSTSARSLGATQVFTRADQPSNAGLTEDLNGFEEMAVFFPLMFLTAAALAAYVMLSRLVHTQRPHIGVMLANGMTRRQVLRHYLGYALVPGLAGAIPGAAAGVLLARLITSLYTRLLSIPVTVIAFHPGTPVAAVAFGLTAAVLAALAPALVASRVVPAEAMRGETPAGGGHLSLIERALPLIRRLPVGWRMTFRGIGRNPRRTIYTIVGVVLALMLVLVSWGMIDTINVLLDRQFVQIQREDATVYFTSPTASTQDLTDVAGVAAVEGALTVPVSVEAGGNHYDTALEVLPADTRMHRFLTSDGQWEMLPATGVALGQSARDQLGVGVGDSVKLVLPGIGSVESTVSVLLDEPLGTLAYMSRSEAERLTGGPLPVNSALITYRAGADPAAVRSAITGLPQVAAFEDSRALYSTMKDYMVLFYAFVGVMLAFGGAMAFALIFSSMSVNIAERTREVATLLAVGTRRRQISRYITAENLLVALLGIPLGLVVGYLAAKAAMASFSSDLFSFDLSIRWTTFLWAAVAILIVGMVSQVPGLRAIRRISIPQVVKERSA